MLFSYHLLYFCTALSLIIMLSSHYHHHKSKTFSQLTQCPFTGTLLLFTKWSYRNQVNFRAPPIKSVDDILLYLFQDTKLQPSYRSAIANKLGNSPIGKDENLTHLLDSFHRDRPKGCRDIPSWNLSLVLYQLTKVPFEPLKEASLKHLTFKTVFLLALGSGSRNGEIHAWLYKIIQRKTGPRCLTTPSPSFLLKNQLAKEGLDSVARVVNPSLALIPWTNHSRLPTPFPGESLL